MDLLSFLMARKAATGDLQSVDFDRKISFGLLLNYVRQHEITGEHGSVTLTNTSAFPFNNSKKTVSLANSLTNTNYAVFAQATSSDGNAGEVEVSDRLVNGFKLSYTGSAKSAVVDYIVIGGFTE